MTSYETLIDAADLAAYSGALIVDCRFDLADPARGEAEYAESHIPGAIYAHLERDLSVRGTRSRGRHPLPAPDRIAEVFGRLGVRPGRQVVAYDAAGGMFAARLWWMLRYMGHSAVAVLDGGFGAWRTAGLPLESRIHVPVPAPFRGRPRSDRLVSVATLSAAVAAPAPRSFLLVDARAAARYRGEVEPIDPRAGHIPGALNHHFGKNLDELGRFWPAARLRDAFIESLGTLPGATAIHYCGSGVSACHNILAQVRAGLPEPRLYGGSWSEWCSDPQRPAATVDRAP